MRIIKDDPTIGMMKNNT